MFMPFFTFMLLMLMHQEEEKENVNKRHSENHKIYNPENLTLKQKIEDLLDKEFPHGLTQAEISEKLDVPCYKLTSILTKSFFRQEKINKDHIKVFVYYYTKEGRE
jgi:hypothetical protein